MAGYSGTPLVKKLGIKAESQVALVNAPASFEGTLGALPERASLTQPHGKEQVDVIVCFATSLAELKKLFPVIRRQLASAGGLWIAWPKRASGVATDLTEDRVREVGLAAGLVDNKVCAVDNTWSGLRFVIRVKDRSKE